MQFPYNMRDAQRQMIIDIGDVIERRSHLVAEAPTGFGKTITAMYAAVQYALKHDKKIIYLVRTNSQEEKVIEESRNLGIFAVALQGRRNMCPLAFEDAEMMHGNAEEVSLLCSKLKKEVLNGGDACPYFSGFLDNPERLFHFIQEGRTAEEVFKKGYEWKICPYEATKAMMHRATLVVMPYIYFLLPFMRSLVLDAMKVELHDIILIVDEAHNFPEFARELISNEITEESLNRMESECVNHGNRVFFDVPCADVAEYIKEAIYSLKQETLEDELLVPHYAFEEELARYMNIGINAVDRLAYLLIEYGTEIREIKMRQRKLPRSYIYHVGNFLMQWKNTYSADFLHMARFDDDAKLEVFCLDPAQITEIVRNVHSSIHMSGTLILENYRSLVNLPEDSTLRRYPSPFPPENLKVLYVKDVTTRYQELENNISRLSEYVEDIISMNRSTIVFFPSYSLMGKVAEDVHCEVLMEQSQGGQQALFSLLNKFRNGNSALFSVFGGRISEGIDFPGNLLEIVVIVGIPYPRPTAKVKMLEKYFDYKFGKGWDFAFREPALIKMRQAIGRLIRSENDRGMAIILDRRAAQFSREISMQETKDPVREIHNFFGE